MQVADWFNPYDSVLDGRGHWFYLWCFHVHTHSISDLYPFIKCYIQNGNHRNMFSLQARRWVTLLSQVLWKLYKCFIDAGCRVSAGYHSDIQYYFENLHSILTRSDSVISCQDTARQQRHYTRGPVTW